MVPTVKAALGTASQPVSSSYNLPLAYLLTCGFFLTVAFALIFRQVYWAVYHRSSVPQEEGNVFAEVVLASYDHSLMNEESVALKRMGIIQQLRESINELTATASVDPKTKRMLYFRRAMINIVIISLLSVALYVIFIVVERFASSTSVVSNLIPSVVVSCFNIILPLCFEQLAYMERWSTDLFVLQLTVVRSTTLRIAGLFVFFYSIFLRRSQYMCWESFVGQYVYNLFIVVMVTEIAKSALTDSINSILYRRRTCKPIPVPRFDTITNAIDLLYAQSIIFFGTFFCPLLPVLGVLRCIVLFYVKRAVTLRFCEPPLRAFKARYSFTELFYGVLLVMLFLTAFPLGYAITRLPTSGAYMSAANSDLWVSNLNGTSPCPSDTTLGSCTACLSTYKPSELVCWRPPESARYPEGIVTTLGSLCQACPSGCGPFRNQPTIYQTATDTYSRWSSTAQSALGFIGTTPFAGLVIVLLLVALMYMHAKVSARKTLAHRMRIERDMERLDKIWILQRYNIILDN